MSTNMRKGQVAASGLSDGREEQEKFLNGLKRYPKKGVPVYIDDKIPEPDDWEKLVQVREDNRFYMGDYVQSENGGLQEIRFDRVYLGEIGETKGAGYPSGKKKKGESN